jgi:hypothetical protein
MCVENKDFKMKRKFTMIVLASLFAQTSFASAVFQAKPESCPSVSAIQSVGVDVALDGVYGGWAGMHQKNNYGTPETWSFLVVVGQANDQIDALKIANGAIKQLTLSEGPIQKDDGSDNWACLYVDNLENKYVGFAATPAVDSMPEQLITRLYH